MFLSVVAMVFAANENILTGSMVQKFNYVQSDQEILLGVKDIPCLDEVKISFNDNVKEPILSIIELPTKLKVSSYCSFQISLSDEEEKLKNLQLKFALEKSKLLQIKIHEKDVHLYSSDGEEIELNLFVPTKITTNLDYAYYQAEVQETGQYTIGLKEVAKKVTAVTGEAVMPTEIAPMEEIPEPVEKKGFFARLIMKIKGIFS